MAKSKTFFKSKHLQDKIIQSNKVITIGIVGVSYGVGVSHLCFSLATYFNKTRTKVGLIEYRNQEAFKFVEEAYEGKKNLVHTTDFVIKSTTYYKEFMGEISSLKEKGHQILIVDFGVYQPEFLTTINNLDIKFIVTRGEEWKVNELYYLLNSQEQADFYNWKIVVPFGVKEELKEIRRETKKKVSSFFFYKDPFLWTKELKNEIEKILEI